MTTQYTTILKLALPVTGELSGSWGDVVNNNITSMVEQAVAGLATINSWSGNAHTLTTANGVSAESRCAMLVLTDTGAALTGAATVICPANSKIYIVKNTCGQAATIKTASGTGVTIPNGDTSFVFCDGTNVVQAVTRLQSADIDFANLKGTGAVVVTNILDEDDMASDSATALATQQSIKAYVDAQIAATNELSEVLSNGNTTGGTNLIVSAGDTLTVDTINETTADNGVVIDGVTVKDGDVTGTIGGTTPAAGSFTGLTLTGDATFGDNDKAIFGAGSDLQIYHDGTTSIIGNTNTHSLFLKNLTDNENYLVATPNNQVALYYNGSAKLATTATGVDITGTTTTGALTSTGLATFSGTIDINCNYRVGSNNTVMGYLAGASLGTGAGSNVSIGYKALQNETTGDYNTAVGALANNFASGVSGSTAFGYYAQANSNATATGSSTIASGNGGTAIGSTAAASGTSSTALGQGATATHASSTALGRGAETLMDNSVALHTYYNSTTHKHGFVTGFVSALNQYSPASTNFFVSFGSSHNGIPVPPSATVVMHVTYTQKGSGYAAYVAKLVFDNLSGTPTYRTGTTLINSNGSPFGLLYYTTDATNDTVRFYIRTLYNFEPYTAVGSLTVEYMIVGA